MTNVLQSLAFLDLKDLCVISIMKKPCGMLLKEGVQMQVLVGESCCLNPTRV